jgi:hypothetical protein
MARARIVEMDLRQHHDVDRVRPGFMGVSKEHQGSIEFIAAQGGVD